MITTRDFKKQISKVFGIEMRQCGFKGTGFEYFQETDEFLIAVYITPGRWGGNCTAGFAVHPKQIDKDSNGKLDLKKLKIYDYEFKMKLWDFARGEFWDYADDETVNLNTLKEIISLLKEKAFPIIEQFKVSLNILEKFEVCELGELHKNWISKTGVYISTTRVRFSWAMTIIFEYKNLEKAKLFAKWAQENADPDLEHEWFGDKDIKRILSK